LIYKRQHSSALDVRSFRTIDCGDDHYLVVATLGDRLAVIKQAAYRVHMEKFSLKELNEAEGEEQCHIEILNMFATFENS
jgi:hypothetical protein